MEAESGRSYLSLRAQGGGPLRRIGGDRPVYDIAQAALPIGTQIEMQEGGLLRGEEQLEEDRESSSSGLQTETSISDCSTEQPQESSNSSDDEDVTIDEVRHLPPEPLPSLGVREFLGLLNGDRGVPEVEEDRESLVEQLEEAATSGSNSNPSLGDEDGQNRSPEGVTNVAYRAIDEGLMVIHGERELRVGVWKRLVPSCLAFNEGIGHTFMK